MFTGNRTRRATALAFLLILLTNTLAPLYALKPVAWQPTNLAPSADSVGIKLSANPQPTRALSTRAGVLDHQKKEQAANDVLRQEQPSAPTMAGPLGLSAASQTTEEIAADRELTGTHSGTVRALNSITLLPEFESGAEFTAELASLQSNVPAPASSSGAENLDMNWIMATTYDPAGNPIGESKKFFDNGGRPLQEQAKVKYRKDASTVYTHVFASQPLYDAYGRGAATTLAAPIDNSSFVYKSNFVQNAGGTAYDYKNFDVYKPTANSTPTDRTNAPEAVGTAPGSLGWYYSTSNSWEPYTPTTAYPYSRQTFYRDGTGNVKKSAGAGEAFKMGSGHEGRSYVTPVISELSEYVSIRNNYFSSAELGELPTSLSNKAIQTISRDANGREAVAIQDKDGKTLMVARPGSEFSVLNSTVLKPAYTFSFNGSDMGTAKNLRITGTGNIKLYESQNGGASYAELYSGAPGSYTSPASLPHLYKIESDQAFTVSYDAAIPNEADRAVCKSCPSQAGDNSICYFKLFASSTVTVTGGSFTLYDMETEDVVSFSSGAALGAGYYKLVNAGTTPITLGYSNGYADISYSFYNHLGQLVATIAPEGVKKLRTNGFSTYATRHAIPFITLNEYDVQGRLVSSKDADGGKGELVYRKDGKLRFSQNAEQVKTGRYSYTNYDALGRPVESGEYSGSIAFNSGGMIAIIEEVSAGGGLTGGTRYDVVVTTYDAEDNSHGQSGYAQDPFYLRGAVSVTKKYSSVTGAPPYGTTNLVSATWYSYDEEGKVTWNIQYIAGLGHKTTDYSYDGLGRLIKRVFQKNIPTETFAHGYKYDAGTQQLYQTYTNTADVAFNPSSVDPSWQLQATYQYYLHGPLKRIELAGNLQGIDYTYTLQGALKAINNVDKSKDPGNDGGNSTLADAYGMVLDYYTDDYQNNRSGIYFPKGVATGSYGADSYSGQIKAMSWWSRKPPQPGLPSDAPTTYVYKYDDRYQFTESTWGNNLNFNNTPATFTATTFNQEKGLSYDANGNIRSLERSGPTGALKDKLVYEYWNSQSQSSSSTEYNTNRLARVDDSGPANDDVAYSYDELGQLVAEVPSTAGKPAKYIRYDVTGKVTLVARDAAFNQKAVEYVYGELGQRIAKKSYNTSNQLTATTYYVGDVVYSQVSGGSAVVQEYEVDGGSGRIGTYYRQDGVYAYELSDHLGNTRAVIARSSSGLDVRMYSDYYPFGMVIQNSGSYRHGYQGKYAEDETAETGWNSFELRMYDSRIARWLQYDPKGEFWSPYIGMGNDPISKTDPDGGETKIIEVRDSKGNHLFNLDDGKKEITKMTVKELYAKGIQWFEPLANNYMPILWMNPEIGKFKNIKHFTWNDIAEFSEVDRWMISYRQEGSGDWKASENGADGFLLVTVNGQPYWPDAIGQIPFAVDYFTDQLESHGNVDRAILETIKSGREYGEGKIFGGTAENGNIYDIYFILRGALYASHRYSIVKNGKSKDLKLNNYSSNNLGTRIWWKDALKYRLR